MKSLATDKGNLIIFASGMIALTLTEETKQGVKAEGGIIAALSLPYKAPQARTGVMESWWIITLHSLRQCWAVYCICQYIIVLTQVI